MMATRMTRRVWLIGSGGAMVGLLAVAVQRSRADTPSEIPATPAETHPASHLTTQPAASAPTIALQPVAETVTDPNALRIPPLLSPSPRDGVRTFELALQRGQMEFEPGRPANTLGINGPYLGPTLRATQGDDVAFAIVNQIGEPTTLHWHGMHLPAAMDGGPHQEIAPDAVWQP